MDQTPPSVEMPPLPPAAPSSSLVSRLLNIFASPGEVFAEVKASPLSQANWLVPTVLLAVAGVLSALIISAQPAIKRQKQAMGEAVIQKMVDSGKMPKEAAEKAMNSPDAGSGIKTVLEAAMAPVGIFISLFWSALIVWLGGLVLGAGGRFGYMRAVEIVGLASMIGLLGLVVRTLLVVTTGNMFAGVTPGLLVKDFDPMNNTVHGVLSVLDLIGFWVMGVRACGLAKLANISFLKAAVWVFGIWLVLTGAMFVIGLAVKRLMGF